VTILTSSFSGKLTGTSNNFTSLLGVSTVTGTIKISWKTDKATPIVQTSTVLTPGAITGGLYVPAAPIAGAYGEFHIGGGVSATGAFLGGDGGASSTTDAVTSQSAAALAVNGTLPAGIKSINLGLGNIAIG